MNTLDEIRELTEEYAGSTLLTLLVWIPERNSLLRIYTTHPIEYPVGIEKTIEVSASWLNQCIELGEPYLGLTKDQMQQVFSDSNLIESLGCTSVVNLPIRRDGRTVGVINMLAPEGTYTQVSIDLLVRRLAADEDAIADLLTKGVEKK